MSDIVSRVQGPQFLRSDQPIEVVQVANAEKSAEIVDVVDIPHGPHRLTPERVQALLSDDEEQHVFPEPRVFDQNGDGKLNVLDLVQKVQSLKLDELDE